jgi:hypothetical protein
MNVSRPAGAAGPSAHAPPPPASAEKGRAAEARFPALLGERRAVGPPPAPVPPPSPRPLPARAPPPAGVGPPSWHQLADRALQAEGRIDALIEAARRGKTFSASELLAVQAEVFRYSQTVEVISRATDRLVGAVKQTLGTQV